MEKCQRRSIRRGGLHRDTESHGKEEKCFKKKDGFDIERGKGEKEISYYGL